MLHVALCGAPSYTKGCWCEGIVRSRRLCGRGQWGQRAPEGEGWRGRSGGAPLVKNTTPILELSAFDMAQVITVRLNKADHQPLGFRLQGGKDFGTPLVVQKVNGGSAAERAGLQAGDALIRVNNTDVYLLRHQEAQDAIRAAGVNLELTVQRGGNTWRPTVTPTGSLPRPGSRPIGGSPALVTTTSLKATPQPTLAFGSGHNNVAKPFGYMNGNDSVKSIVNKQYNTPVNMYSDKTIAETLSAQTEVLAGGVLGVNFKKNEKTYDSEKSAVFKVLQEEQNDPEPVEVAHQGGTPAPSTPVSGLRHVQAPVTRPDAPVNNTGGLPPGQNICEECERLITGVFVRIKDKNLHVECFKCSTCGSSLKNQGYYNLNGKLYCDIHAKLVARQNPPAPNLEPVTVPPGGRVPTNTYSTPLPPLATNNYSNGSSSLFSPSSNLSGPKPFGSSIGSAYSPSLSPRSAPLSPARPVAAPAPAPPAAPPLGAPFAPTQNVKSVVWPPPANNFDDEPSDYGKETTTQNVKKHTFDSKSAVAIVEQQVVDQFVTSKKQKEEISSSHSYSTATISSLTKTSQSESAIQSKQVNQEMSTGTMQSFSQKSSESQSSTVYQSQANIQSINQEKTEFQDVNKIQTAVAKENMQSQMTTDVQTTNNLVINTEFANKEVQESNKIDLNEVKQNETSIQQKTENVVLSQKDTEHKTFSKDKYIDTNDLYNQTLSQEKANPDTNKADVVRSMVDALTTAPDRPYSPLPTPSLPISNIGQTIPVSNTVPETFQQTGPNNAEENVEHKHVTDINQTQLPPRSSPMFLHEQKRGTTPIPPIKTYNPPEKVLPPIPMPEQTNPYIPPDFKIIIESKEPRDTTSSPLVDALTTAPDIPFTPTQIQNQEVGRGSLRDALTIAPDRPYSPFGSTSTNQTSQYMTSSVSHVTETNLSDIIKPIATQTSTLITDKIHSEFSAMQNTCQLQSSAEMSAFRPVSKQIFTPPQPEEFCKLSSFPPISNDIKTSFAQATKTKQETMYSESMVMQHSSVSSSMDTQCFSSVKNAQNYFEQLDKKESLTSSATRSKSGLHKPDSIPPYQRNFEQLPSQRGITPELYNAPAVLQRPVTPTTQLPRKSKEKSFEPNSTHIKPEVPVTKIPQLKTPVPQSELVHFHKDTPITMTFQPVTDENFLRFTPSRSRPSTPSLINKPAPIIPHYQMNLVTVEHLAPESHLYEPSSREASRSPTPKPRSRSPAQGPPPNPLKAQAPRVKENFPQNYTSESFMSQESSNKKQNETEQRGFRNATLLYNANDTKNWNQSQIYPSVVKEQKHTNVGYKTENYSKDDMKIKEDSLFQENYGQRQMQSQNVTEQGNTRTHTTRKTFEEFERTQSAKMVEIRKGGSSLPGEFEHLDSNIRPSNINHKQVFPPPLISVSPTPQSSSFNQTNPNFTSAAASRSFENYEPTKPSISGANQGPVCDPTPSTGSSVGAAARGKTFGVSSAPKRGRGVLNKAALPGSRVPLCGSFNELLATSSPHKTEFKSPAEERLIRKMAKMALNGYEIGIQRKIKPADHIQSMADKIQDTVVTKHPLNTDTPPTLENHLAKPSERVFKKPDNISDKIKDPLKNNHTTEYLPKPNILIPPPLPSSPVPIFNVHNTNIGIAINTDDDKKKQEIVAKSTYSNVTPDERIERADKYYNGNGYSSSEDSYKDKVEHNYTGTLKKTGLDKSSFLNSMNGFNGNQDNKTESKLDSVYSNTLNKRKLFEKPENISNSSTNEIKSNESNTRNKTSVFDLNCKTENAKNTFIHNDEDSNKKKELPNHLHNNSLYTLKTSPNNGIQFNGVERSNNHKDNTKLHADETKSLSDIDEKTHQENNDEEVVVRRRQKKNIRNDDGRRDSHIIARPMSTIQCADVADGLYPVCHKCDKAITRGPFITALGRIWCPEHFICVNATCRRPLQDIGFVEENGQLYCEFCFEQYIAPACDKCHAKIKGDCLNAIGKHYHPECFNCVYCGKLFGNNPFFLEDGLPYCEADWNDLFTTKCFACGFPVEAGDRWVEALNNNYHSQCFNCTVCKKNLEGQSFFAKGGRPFCKIHAR
ncbi:unnamed protein product [Arctia plantaginis]|uniref:PDZ and LIM domain protein Zasp n=1 Tax=Arctia plantaginis TaxID=874455 RepID=A0A8S1ADY3_ARCPL|nr:unnamed protein product [Arctia plantaginis]